METSYVIGITGGSGSGKSSLLKTLRDEFDLSELAILSQDNYYKKRIEQIADTSGVCNFDLPSSFVMDEYIADLEKLRTGGTVERMEYTYNNEKATASKIVTNTAPVIIAEGLFVMHLPDIRSRLDLTVFVEVNDILKLKRRIIRDQEERNYPLEDVLYRYEHHVLPSYKRYIAPFKAEADVIINNDRNMDSASSMMLSYIRSLVS